MLIGGFQKMTMLDFPGKVACTIFTYGCNLRCPFCHNAMLVTQKTELFDEEEIFSYLKKRSGILDGVCITGGEPMLQKDIFDFIRKVKEMGFLVKLDTNGCFPEKLEYVLENKLVDYVAMDIKNSKEKYAETVGISDFDITPIEKSVELIMNSGVDYEFRTTVVKQFHSENTMKSIGTWLKGAKKYCLQNFEDTGNLIGQGLCAHDPSVLKAFKSSLADCFGEICVRGI